MSYVFMGQEDCENVETCKRGVVSRSSWLTGSWLIGDSWAYYIRGDARPLLLSSCQHRITYMPCTKRFVPCRSCDMSSVNVNVNVNNYNLLW